MQGSCHCGRVEFEVDGAVERVLACNCSICFRTGFLHWIVPRDRFRVLQGEGELTTYTFGTHTAKHTFCKTCGVKPFYTPRSHPDQVSVNARCLEVDPGAYEVEPFDGQNWDENVDSIR
jgi:hypothetical protein